MQCVDYRAIMGTVATVLSPAHFPILSFAYATLLSCWSTDRDSSEFGQQVASLGSPKVLTRRARPG